MQGRGAPDTVRTFDSQTLLSFAVLKDLANDPSLHGHVDIVSLCVALALRSFPDVPVAFCQTPSCAWRDKRRPGCGSAHPARCRLLPNAHPRCGGRFLAARRSPKSGGLNRPNEDILVAVQLNLRQANRLCPELWVRRPCPIQARKSARGQPAIVRLNVCGRCITVSYRLRGWGGSGESVFPPATPRPPRRDVPTVPPDPSKFS